MMQKKVYKITIGNPEQDVTLTVKRELSETEYNLVQGIISEFQKQIAKIEEESNSFVDLIVDMDESIKDRTENCTYAISDEVHQLFVPGRAGQVRDVLIDSAGSLLGIIIIMSFEKLLIKINKKHKI